MAYIRSFTWNKTNFEDEEALIPDLFRGLKDDFEIAAVDNLKSQKEKTNEKPSMIITKYKKEESGGLDSMNLKCMLSSKTVLLLPDEDLQKVLQDLKQDDYVMFLDPTGNILIIILFYHCSKIYQASLILKFHNHQDHIINILL